MQAAWSNSFIFFTFATCTYKVIKIVIAESVSDTYSHVSLNETACFENHLYLSGCMINEIMMLSFSIKSPMHSHSQNVRWSWGYTILEDLYQLQSVTECNDTQRFFNATTATCIYTVW